MAVVYPGKYEVYNKNTGAVTETEFNGYIKDSVLYFYDTETPVPIAADEAVRVVGCNKTQYAPDSIAVDTLTGDVTVDESSYARRQGDFQIDGAGRLIEVVDTVTQPEVDAALAVIDSEATKGKSLEINIGTQSATVKALDDGVADSTKIYNATQGTTPKAIYSGTAQRVSRNILTLDNDTSKVSSTEVDRNILAPNSPVTFDQLEALYATGQKQLDKYGDPNAFPSNGTGAIIITEAGTGKFVQVPLPARNRQSDVGGTINFTVSATLSVLNSWTFTAPFDGTAFNFSLRILQRIDVDPPGARIGWRLRVLKNGAVLFTSPDYPTVDQGVGPTIDGAYHENARIEPCLAGDQFTLQLLFFGNNGAPGNNASVYGQRVKIDFMRQGLLA